MIGAQAAADTFRLEDALTSERPRLVRLCAHFSGDRDAAEDLAQETLIEAWRRQDRLTDQAGYAQWLSAIARNVCLRWSRRRGRERSLLALPERSGPSATPPLEELAALEDDITVELERSELADLLDRALALLPAETSRVLVEKYIEELPLAEVAARLGLSEGAIAVRLHRGKLALRRVLAGELGHEAAAFGLLAPAEAGWQETRLWCPLCGQRRLLGRMGPAPGELAVRCPSCTAEPNCYVTYAQLPELLRGAKSYKPAFARVMIWADDLHRRYLSRRMLPCPDCGHLTPLREGLPIEATGVLAHLGHVYVRCARCNGINSTARAAVALCLPEGRQFWHTHPKIRFRPGATIEAAGQPAIVSSFESVLDSARLDVVTTRDTFEVISVHTIP